MVSPVQSRTVIDINASVRKHENIVHNLLAAHALSGCDTVASYYGIGKATVLKILRTGKYPLNGFSSLDSPFSEALQQAEKFVVACYHQQDSLPINEARKSIWASKLGRKKATAPKLCILPPTIESFTQNVARAQLQIALWSTALNAEPPHADVTCYGWLLSDGMLQPKMLETGHSLVPDNLMNLMKCTCKSEFPCRTHRCSCKRSGLACTLFCACVCGQSCQNENNHHHNESDDEAVDDMTGE